MIEWEAFKDKHCLGHTEFGKVWVRTDKDNKVTGLYTMWGETNKIVPTTEEEETLDGIKIVAQILVETKMKDTLMVKSLLKMK